MVRIIHDTECSYVDQVSLTNTKLKLKHSSGLLEEILVYGNKTVIKLQLHTVHCTAERGQKVLGFVLCKNRALDAVQF